MCIWASVAIVWKVTCPNQILSSGAVEHDSPLAHPPHTPLPGDPAQTMELQLHNNLVTVPEFLT